jgi:hypothetical protein
MRFGILLAHEKHLQDRIISLREAVWAHKSSLTSPHFIEVFPELNSGAPYSEIYYILGSISHA